MKRRRPVSEAGLGSQVRRFEKFAEWLAWALEIQREIERWDCGHLDVADHSSVMAN